MDQKKSSCPGAEDPVNPMGPPAAATVDAFAICLKRKPVPASRVKSWRAVFPRLQIFEAVDGRTIEPDTDPRLHLIGKMHLREANMVARDSVFALPTVGAVGCALSHLALFRRCVDTGRPLVVVEQDVEFDARCARVLPEAIRRLPPDAHYASLMYISQPNTAPYNRMFRRLLGPHCDGNQCYYVAPEGARRVLRHALPIFTQWDLLVGIVAHMDAGFRAYTLNARLYSVLDVLTDNLGSSIQSFAIKKYLPRSNGFYYFVIGLLIILIMYMFYTVG